MPAQLSLSTQEIALNAPPAPVVVRGYPLVGSLPDLLRDAPRTLLEASRAHPGEVVSLRLGPVDLPIVSDPEHIQDVLMRNAHDFSKAGMWAATRALVGDGLLNSDGEAWKRQRRMLQPLFNPRHVAGLGDLMVGAARTVVDELAQQTGPVDMGLTMTVLTQRVLLETMFGTALPTETAERVGRNIETAFKALNTRLFLYWLPEWCPRPGDAEFKASVALIDATVNEIVAQRRANPVDRRDLLSLLLSARDMDTGAGLTDQQIRDHLVTLFVAGQDTTAVALTWMWWLLDQHPEVDARFRAEIDEVLQGRLPTVDDLPKLSYARRVFQETLRLYPPAWIIPRYTPGGTVIGGRSVKPGTSLLVSPYLVHRDPRHWEDPERFDPDRFTEERIAERHRMAYIPFGAGGRMCIGMHFALMEGVLAAAVMAQRVRPRLAPGQKVEPAARATLKPKYGMKMLVERV